MMSPTESSSDSTEVLNSRGQKELIFEVATWALRRDNNETFRLRPLNSEKHFTFMGYFIATLWKQSWSYKIRPIKSTQFCFLPLQFHLFLFRPCVINSLSCFLSSWHSFTFVDIIKCTIGTGEKITPPCTYTGICTRACSWHTSTPPCLRAYEITALGSMVGDGTEQSWWSNEALHGFFPFAVT